MTPNVRVRCWSLGLMFLFSIFLWLFIAASLFLCYTFLRTNPSLMEVRQVFGSAMLIGIACAIPLSLALRFMSPKIMLTKVRGLHPAQRRLEQSFNSLGRLMEVPSGDLRLFKSSIPISFAVEATKPTVVMSESLLSLLTKDEVEAVMAHEYAHIKNSDTMMKSLITAYRTMLPFDPIIRMVEAAFHREREILADETAARVTRKPLSLASAILKIYRAFPKNSFSSQGTLSILGVGSTLTKRHPSVSDRLNHLIPLAQSYSINHT
jgi:Zn-dependent protease with chaperone function